jgi:hypothetical protein
MLRSLVLPWKRRQQALLLQVLLNATQADAVLVEQLLTALGRAQQLLQHLAHRGDALGGTKAGQGQLGNRAADVLELNPELGRDRQHLAHRLGQLLRFGLAGTSGGGQDVGGVGGGDGVAAIGVHRRGHRVGDRDGVAKTSG